MAGSLNINKLIKTLENAIEERFGAQPAYRQAKAVLEGKAERLDVKTLIDDSRAMFAGSNKPEALMAAAVDHLKGRITANAAALNKNIVDSRVKPGKELNEAKKIVAGIPRRKKEDLAAGKIGEKDLAAIRAVAEAGRAELDLKRHAAGVEKSVQAVTVKLDRLKKQLTPKEP